MKIMLILSPILFFIPFALQAFPGDNGGSSPEDFGTPAIPEPAVKSSNNDEAEPPPPPKKESEKTEHTTPEKVEKVKFDPKLPEARLMRKTAFTPKGFAKLKSFWITPYGFKWAKDNPSALEYTFHKDKPLQIFNEPVLNATLIIESGRIASAEFVLHNASAKPLMREPFVEKVKTVIHNLRGLTGVKEFRQKGKSIPANHIVYVFDCGDRFWKLTCLFREPKKVTPEGLICWVQSKKIDEEVGASSVSEGWVKLADLPASAVKGEEGETWISNVPVSPIPEDSKDFCAAVMTRLFLYYGREASVKELSDILGEKAAVGRDIKALDAALDNLKRKEKLAVSPKLYEVNSSSYRKLADAYNKDAAKRKSDPLPLDAIKNCDFEPFNTMMLRALNGDKVNTAKVRKIISENINRGIPLVWIMEAGMFPEKGKSPEIEKGHLVRLIIGYKWDSDVSKEEIIFTDCWGKGHEKKSMRLDEATAVTRRIFSIRPEK